jgi:Na+-transporting methylmalonyl-CoA/oxaloacetate decarboxylase gamma subunit
MQERRYYFQESGGMNKAWVGLLIMGVFIFLVFLLLKSLYKILWIASPVIIIATLFIDRQVIMRFLRMIGRVFSRNPLTGVVLIILSILVFPFLSVGMLINAILNRKIKAKAKDFGYSRPQETFTEYEEMEINRPADVKAEKEYDILFKDKDSGQK